MLVLITSLILLVDISPNEQWYFFSDYEVPTYCTTYDNKFMDSLHRSLEWDCTKNYKKKKCRALLRRTTYYSKLRSKWCYR